MVGYAAVAGGADGGVAQATNGGNDSTNRRSTVSDVVRLATELQRPEPRVIFLDGMHAAAETIKVTLDRDSAAATRPFIGVGANSGLTGAGLDLSYSDNIILRNLKISKVCRRRRRRDHHSPVAPHLDRPLRPVQRSRRHR